MTSVRAFCEDCQRPQVIVPTGKKQREGWSAEWHSFVPHWVDGQLCRGSNKLV